MAGKKSNSPNVEKDEDEECAVYCSLCKTGFSGTVPYRQHLKGSNHQKAETKQLMKEKYGPKYLEALEKMQTDRKEICDELKLPATDDEALVFTCHPCQKVCTGHLSYKLHLASHKHAKKLKNLKLMSELKQEVSVQESANDPLYETVPQIKPYASCSTCKKTFSGPEGYKQHMSSEVHKKMLQNKLLEAMNEVPCNGDDDIIYATCEECGKNFSGPIPYQQHLISEVHKNKAKDKALAKEVSDKLKIDEDGYIQCLECGKNFSGPRPLYQHLKGPAHSKQQKKDKLIQNLIDQFPEFLKMSDEMDSDGDSDSEYLVCTICHKCFSGPESARDHFRSKKHLKTKKEKKRIEKLKEMKKTKDSTTSILKEKLTEEEFEMI